MTILLRPIQTLTCWCLLMIMTNQVPAQQSGPIYINIKPVQENYEKAMALTDANSSLVDSIIYLSIEYSYLNKDSSLALGEQSTKLGKDLPDRSIYAKALLELGDSYRIFGDIEKGEQLINQGKGIYDSLGNKGQVAYANNKLGALYIDLADYEEAIKYYLSAMATWEASGDSSNLVNANINVADLFWRLNDMYKADAYSEKALELAKKLGQDRPIMNILNNQGLYFLSHADNLSDNIKTDSDAADELRDSIQILLDKSLDKHQQSLVIARKMNNLQSILRSLINIADLKDKNGSFSEAISLSLEAESISQKLGDITLLILIKRNLSEFYRHAGRIKTSILYGEEALKLAKENKLEGLQSGVNEELYQSYKSSGNFKKALQNHEEMKAYQQKNDRAEKNKAIAEVETKYQTTQKEKRILEQENDILQLETSKAKIEKQRNYFIGGALLLSILTFFGYQLNKTRKERNDKKAFAEALIYAQEEERKRIARDLHDGIGQSLLLIKKQMASNHQTTVENHNLITETLEEVRSISRDLHPFQLEKFGLTATIKGVIQKVEKSSDLFITTEIENIDDLLSDKAEINIYRTIQESFSNIVKHAQASAAKIIIKRINNQINVKVMDNGKGFDHEITIIRSKSLGLRTMQERISTIGGNLQIKPNETGGTIIEFTIPEKA